MTKIKYSGYRFPPEIIQQAIWLYVRFTLSFRDVEDLLAERGIVVSYETVRRWVNHFGPKIAADLRKRRPKPHTIWHLDEVYLKIDGRLVYLWRAVDAEAKPKALEAGTRTNGDWFSVEAEQLSLFSPVGRQPRRQAHQCLGGKLRRLSAIDDGRGDVGRQPGWKSLDA